MIAGLFAASATAGLSAESAKAVKKEDPVTDQTGSADSFGLKKTGLDQLRKKLDVRGKVCGVELSRIILGGNPFGGWAHCRNLNYVNTLVKAYNTHEKIMDTFRMCEDAGINAFLSNSALAFYFHDYQKLGGKIFKPHSQKRQPTCSVVLYYQSNGCVAAGPFGVLLIVR